MKIYGQMAAIMPFEIVAWEKLFWFLKFLVPKLIVRDPDADKIDKLLESVDLSSYGLERTKLNHGIALDAGETELDPQNPNPRGAHEDEEERDPLDEIIRNFNERWFHGWEMTMEEYRVKYINVANDVKNHPDYEEKYKTNPDLQNRKLAFDKILAEVMLQNRRKDLEFYRLGASNPEFWTAFGEGIRHLLDAGLL